MAPPIGIGHRHRRRTRRDERDFQRRVDSRLAYPVDESIDPIGCRPWSPDGDVVLEVGLSCSGDGGVSLGQPGEQGDGASDLRASSLDHSLGQLAPGGPVAHVTQHLPARESLDQVGVFGRQGDQELVQPTDRPLDAGLIGSQDTDGGQQVAEIEIAPALGELSKVLVADLDLARAMAPSSRGPSPGGRCSQYIALCGQSASIRASKSGTNWAWIWPVSGSVRIAVRRSLSVHGPQRAP